MTFPVKPPPLPQGMGLKGGGWLPPCCTPCCTHELYSGPKDWLALPGGYRASCGEVHSPERQGSSQQSTVGMAWSLQSTCLLALNSGLLYLLCCRHRGCSPWSSELSKEVSKPRCLAGDLMVQNIPLSGFEGTCMSAFDL